MAMNSLSRSSFSRTTLDTTARVGTMNCQQQQQQQQQIAE
jgi:hypothetical protein